jgi:hypothetical protein
MQDVWTGRGILPHTLSVPGSVWVKSTGICRASVRQVLVLELTTVSFEGHNGSCGGLSAQGDRSPPAQISTQSMQYSLGY